MESRILIGDCRTTLASLPAQSVQCCVTSPPYFALRSYLPKGHPDKHLEIGSEATIEKFIDTMLEVFEAVRRVLRDDGTLWVNLGDSYAGGGGYSPGSPSNQSDAAKQRGAPANQLNGARIDGRPVPSGLKPGDQCLVPYRFALAMQAAGWWLRSTIIWRKLSPMPESISGVRWRRCVVKVASNYGPDNPHPNDRDGIVHSRSAHGFGGATFRPCEGCDKCRDTDGYVLRRGRWRPTQAHEPIFLFTKSERYFCDGDAVAEAVAEASKQRQKAGRKNQWGHIIEASATDRRSFDKARSYGSDYAIETRNPRSVMTFPSEPYKAAHFATFPSSLPAFAIRAGTSSAGCCPACGACYAPVVESERVATRPGEDNQIDASGMANRDPQRHVAVNRVTGYRAQCRCNAGDPIPCTVLDPFLGSGTTLQAARALGRSGIGCELNEEYAALARVRIETPPKWAKEKPKRKPRIVFSPQQTELF